MSDLDDTDLEGPTALPDGWAPSALPPLPQMNSRERLACAFRILASDGFCENLAGHITMLDRDDDTMLVNPWGLWWGEVTASDICRIAADGTVIEGKWDVTPAIHIHTQLHLAHSQHRVIVHNHPYWTTVLAALGSLPEIFHQTGCMFDNDMVFVDEYRGEISDVGAGQRLADQIGSAQVAVLANHGVIVSAATLEEAVYRVASFDRQCRLAYDVLMAKSAFAPGVATPVPSSARGGLRRALIDRGAPVFWAGAVRQLLRSDADVLT